MKFWPKWIFLSLIFLGPPVFSGDVSLNTEELFQELHEPATWISGLQIWEGRPVLLTERGPLILSAKGQLTPQSLIFYFAQKWQDSTELMINFTENLRIFTSKTTWEIDWKSSRIEPVKTINPGHYELGEMGIFHYWVNNSQRTKLAFLKPSDQILQADTRGFLVKRNNSLIYFSPQGKEIAQSQAPNFMFLHAAYDKETRTWLLYDGATKELQIINSTTDIDRNMTEAELFLAALLDSKKNLYYPLALEISQRAKKIAQNKLASLSDNQWTMTALQTFSIEEKKLLKSLSTPPFWLVRGDDKATFQVIIHKDDPAVQINRIQYLGFSLIQNPGIIENPKSKFALPPSLGYNFLIETQSKDQYWITID